MSRKIEMRLTASSINEAIKELREYRKWVERKTKELTERLAMIGAAQASVRYHRATYEGVNDTAVNLHRIPNGWAIRAKGDAVFYIEFGAGVYYNGAEPYPKSRPAEVDRIGEHGKGRGKQKAWSYYDDNGNLQITHGTPAAMPMYYATVEMERELRRIAREVFG